MYHCEFSEQDKEIIKHAVIYDESPMIRKRMAILWYKILGYQHYEIAQVTGASLNTITTTIRRYIQGGLVEVRKRRPYRPQGELEEYRNILAEHFANHPPTSLKHAALEIEKLTGIQRSLSSVRSFLHSLGMRRRKVGMVPGKADPDEREDFINNELSPVLEEAKSGKRHVYFVDAAHFVLAPVLGFLWSLTRLFIRAPAGRKRFNILGALNAITHEVVTITNDTYINAHSVCALLYKLAGRHSGESITLILDNARYQKCFIVTNLAHSLHIGLLYLPPYSPNLNIIERLWKFIKKEALYSKYYDNFVQFKDAILYTLNATHQAHKEKLDALLSLRFQRIRKTQIVTI
jgi:transposase